MRYLLFTAALIALNAVSANAQLLLSEPVILPTEGYIITSAGDTLRGKVNVVSSAMDVVIQIGFKDDKTGQKSKFKAADIKGFAQKRNKFLAGLIKDGLLDKNFIHYEARKHPKKDKIVFMERLMNDPKTRVYAYPGEITTSSGISTGIGTFSTPDLDSYSYLVAKNGSTEDVMVESRNFKKSFPPLVADCPAFNDELAKDAKRNKFLNLGMLLKEYNVACK